MKTLALLICLTVLHSIWMVSSIEATTYYVDQNHPSASDANHGSLNEPWVTVQHAGITAAAGDTVLIRTGTYNEHLYFENGGNSSTGYIIFAAYPGEMPIIDGTGITESSNGIMIDQSYIKLIGLEVRNWGGNGIWIANCAHVEISDCIVHDVFYGIGVSDGAHDFIFNRTEVHHFTLYGFDVSPSEYADCYNGVFNDCVAHTASDSEQNVDGFALGDGNQSNFAFNRCTAYDVYDGFDIQSPHATLNGCVAYDCWNGCYKLWEDHISLINCVGYRSDIAIVELDWNEIPGAVTLTNCTFFDSGTYGIWIENAGDTLRMVNCILAGGDNIGLAFEQMGTDNYFGDYNLFHHNQNERAVAVAYTDEFTLDQIANGNWTSYSGQDAHSLVSHTANEIFVNPALYDMHLSPTSIALDHGTNTITPSQDIEGNPRPSGDGYDIGAYEYVNGTSVSRNTVPAQPVFSPQLYQNHPNPFNPNTEIDFYLPADCDVCIEIYNLKGEKVSTLIAKRMIAGHHTVTFSGMDKNGSILPSGIYFYLMKTDHFQKTRKLTLIR